MKERTFGNVAAKSYKSNLRSTIRQPQKLLGKSMEDLDLEALRITDLVPIVESGFTTEGGQSTPAYSFFYQDEDVIVTPEQAMAVLLKHQLKHVLELGVTSKECCIAIPNNATYAMREALFAAAEIAGVNVLKLVSSSSCLALDYGLLGGKARTEKSFATLFLDLGHSGCNIGVTRFFDGGWDMVGIDTFTNFCGELMDERIIDLLDEKFNAKFGSHFKSNAKAVSKVEAVLVKMKKTLVVDASASQTIDYLYDDRDFKCELSREEMWS